MGRERNESERGLSLSPLEAKEKKKNPKEEKKNLAHLSLEVGHRCLCSAPHEELEMRLIMIDPLLLLPLLLPLGGGDADEDLDLSWKKRE